MLARNCFLVFWLRSTGDFWYLDVFLLFLDDHNFISNHPQDLKLVFNGAPCDLLQSVPKNQALKQNKIISLFFFNVIGPKIGHIQDRIIH
jgi:hypothetical protein